MPQMEANIFQRHSHSHQHWLAVTSPKLIGFCTHAVGCNLLPLATPELRPITYPNYGTFLKWTIAWELLNEQEQLAFLGMMVEKGGITLDEALTDVQTNGLGMPATSGSLVNVIPTPTEPHMPWYAKLQPSLN